MASLLLLLAAGAACGGTAPGEEGPPRPNVVLIISDDQSWTDFGFMGHPEIRTPNLDRLASRSAVFPNGYAAAPLCRPSLASILTGLYPHQHGICTNDPPEGVDRREMLRFIRRAPTLPRLLRDKGYRTLQTGKFWEGHFSEAGFTHGMTTRGRHGEEGLVIGRQTMKPIQAFIEGGPEPFFIWYAPMMPHNPHDPPGRILERYLAPGRDPEVARYWAMCEWFDETCGELLACLDAKGLAERTLIAFVVDNGWLQGPGPLGKPGGKNHPREAGVRTPVLLRWPGRLKQGRYPDLVSAVDLVPTILAACGVSPPPGLPGLDLLPAAAGGGRLAREAVFGEVFLHSALSLSEPALNVTHRWARQGDWKLIAPVDSANFPLELYNLVDDPGEARDLAAAQPGRAAQVLELLDGWWKIHPITPRQLLPLFNRKNLDGLHAWLKAGGRKDPRKVFEARDSMIHVSGEDQGYLSTDRDFQDYHLVVEYRWGKETFGSRSVRNSGLLLHATGPDGNAGSWMSSIECQLAQGCAGDLIPIRGKDASGAAVPVSFRSEVALGPDRRPRWKEGGEPRVFTGGQLWWSLHDPEFQELIDTRGRNDLESPLGEWTRIECTCRGRTIAVKVNGVLVNRCREAYPSSGKILLQSEGFEMEVRRFEVHPLEGTEEP